MLSCLFAPPRAHCYTKPMTRPDRTARRAALAGCLMLSACAAAGSGPAAAGQPNAYGAYLAARYADAAQDPATAAQFYSIALAADPENATLLNQDFIASVLAGSPGAAALAGQIQGNALAVMLRGNQAASTQQYATALQDFSQLPGDGLAGLIRPLLVAWVKFGGGDTPGALALLSQKFTNPDYGAVYVLNAALIADAAGDTADAAKLYTAVGGQAPNLRLAQILASWQRRQGNPQGAQTEFSELIAGHPDLGLALPGLEAQASQPVIATTTQGLAEAYLTLAGSLNQPSQNFLKVSFLRLGLMLRPDLSAARLLLASALAGDNLPPNAPPPPPAAINAAMETLGAIPASDPLYAPAMLQKAGLLSRMNQPDAAATLLTQLSAAQPGNLNLLAAAADALRDNNQCAAAAADYTQAITAIGPNPPAGAWTLFFDRGICEDQLGNATAAAPDLQQALTLAPNQPYVLNYIAYDWAEHGEHLAQAQTMLEQAVSLDPNDGAVIDSLGYLNLRQHNTRQALSLLTQAVQLSPDDAEINAHLGDAFAQAGQRLQAVYQWSRALSLNPDPKLAAQLQADINQ